MRKIKLLLLVASLAISTNLFSQKKVQVGFYAGTSFTSLSGADDLASYMSDTLTQAIGKDFPISKKNRSFLFNGGAFVLYNIAPNIDFKGGIEYAPKGQKFKGEVYLSTNFNMESQVLIQETILKIAYFEFPVSVQFSTKSVDDPYKTYFYANLGLSPGIKAFSKLTIYTSLVERGFDNSGTTEEEIESSHLTETLPGINGFDFGVFCSVGVSGKSAFLDLKYDRGLTNTMENSNDLPMKNNMLALCLGFKF